MTASMATDRAPAGSEAETACPRRGWRSQFGNPQGWMGRCVGRLMASKNAPINRAAVEVLGIQQGDAILEIGFGPGTAIAWAAERAGSGYVAGVDRSATMVEQAARRNRKAIAQGRVELKLGLAASIPWPDARFDRVFVVNNYHIWAEPRRELGEVRRVLKPGGLLVLALRMKHPTRTRWVAPGMTPEEVEAAIRHLKETGFPDVRTEMRHVGRDVVFVLAR